MQLHDGKVLGAPLHHLLPPPPAHLQGQERREGVPRRAQPLHGQWGLGQLEERAQRW